AAVLFLHAVSAIKPLIATHRDLELPDEVFENFLRHMGLENPLRAQGVVDRRRILALVTVRFLLLPAPSVGFVVMPPDPMIELSGKSADDRFVTAVGPSQTSARKSAKVAVRTHDHHGLPHLLNLYRGD